MRLTKSLGFAGALILSAILGGTLIGSALATDTDATTGEDSEYCDVFMDSLATELGTDRDGLVAAGKTAALAAVDAALAAGDLTDDQATAARERIEAYDGSGCGFFGHGIGFGREFAHGFARGFLGADVFEAAAEALGIESSELIGELRDAGSLQALAEELGVGYDAVSASVLAAVQADLDAAVAEGMSQERADAALERITTWLDEGGEVGGLRGGHHRVRPLGQRRGGRGRLGGLTTLTGAGCSRGPRRPVWLHGMTPKPVERELARPGLHRVRPMTSELRLVLLWLHRAQPQRRTIHRSVDPQLNRAARTDPVARPMCIQGPSRTLGPMHTIEVSNLTKRYGDQVAVDGVSFTVEPGEIFAILGPNGAGKTTTVEAIVGLRTPDSGTIRVLGLDPQTDRDALRQRVGVQLQESELPERMTVAEAVALFASFYADPADPAGLIEDLGLTEKRDTQFRNLSGGQKQRLSIALALVGKPQVAALDELSTGLDPQARRETWHLIESIRDRGVTVLLVTHLMEEAERLADRVAVIDGGRIVAIDTPAGIISRVNAEQKLRFRPSAPIDDRLLTDLPEVSGVERAGPVLVVTGTGNLIHAVTSVLAQHQVVANDLRVEQASLDDAYLALTARPANELS